MTATCTCCIAIKYEQTLESSQRITFYLSHLMTKPIKWHVRQAKTQISLGICPVWSESSLSASRKLGSLATHWAHSEDSWSDWADAQDELSLRWAHMPFCWFCHEAAHLIRNILQYFYVRVNVFKDDCSRYIDISHVDYSYWKARMLLQNVCNLSIDMLIC